MREVPEQLKARRIEINAGAGTKVAKQENHSKQIDIGDGKAA